MKSDMCWCYWVLGLFLLGFPESMQALNRQTMNQMQEILQNLNVEIDSIHEELETRRNLMTDIKGFLNAIGFGYNNELMDETCGGNGWFELSPSTCIKILDRLYTHLDSWEACSSEFKTGTDIEYPHPLQIPDASVNTKIIDILQNITTVSAIWIGLTENYTNFGNNSASDSVRKCVEFRNIGYRGQWFYVECERKNSVICEKTIPRIYFQIVRKQIELMETQQKFEKIQESFNKTVQNLEKHFTNNVSNWNQSFAHIQNKIYNNTSYFNKSMEYTASKMESEFSKYSGFISKNADDIKRNNETQNISSKNLFSKHSSLISKNGDDIKRNNETQNNRITNLDQKLSNLQSKTEINISNLARNVSMVAEEIYNRVQAVDSNQSSKIALNERKQIELTAEVRRLVNSSLDINNKYNSFKTDSNRKYEQLENQTNSRIQILQTQLQNIENTLRNLRTTTTTTTTTPRPTTTANSRGPCDSSQYRCRSGLCIQKKFMCDGHKDCSDNDDESNCRHKCRGKCSTSTFEAYSVELFTCCKEFGYVYGYCTSSREVECCSGSGICYGPDY